VVQEMTLAIIGAGSWGTALSIVLAPKFERVRLWVHEEDLAARMNAARENDVYLKGFKLAQNVDVLTDLGAAVDRAGVVVGVMPSRHARGLYSRMVPHLEDSMIFVSATKGIENGTLLRMSEVIAEVTGMPKIAILSGPTFAREVASGEPAAIVVAALDPKVATEVQTAFSGPSLRLYTNQDPIGVEVGAALKNVIAIGAGVCKGLGLGNNTIAALITRGLAEISRLAVAMGGEPKTLAGLAGLGDLVLTCSGELSRNRQVGLELARGRTIEDITGSMAMVAEGVETCAAAVGLGAKFGVDLPIIQQMHAVIHRGKSPQEALRDLMERTLKGE
jgi:glycerol-3-phosphate dehydrogenase (NAD(P)+)